MSYFPHFPTLVTSIVYKIVIQSDNRPYHYGGALNVLCRAIIGIPWSFDHNMPLESELAQIVLETLIGGLFLKLFFSLVEVVRYPSYTGPIGFHAEICYHHSNYYSHFKIWACVCDDQ